MKSNWKKEKAIQLRLEGRSYGQIMKKINISSKGTLSYWFKDIELTPEAERKLSDNIAKAKKRGLLAFNNKRTQIIRKQNQDITQKSQQQIRPLSKYELLLVGAALYWGEGCKKHPKRGYPYISFANSDPDMVKIFMRFLREGLNIPSNKIKAGVIVHPNVNIDQCKEYWASITSLPAQELWVSVNISSASQRKRHKNSLPYGTVQVRVHNRLPFFQVQGYINSIAASKN